MQALFLQKKQKLLLKKYRFKNKYIGKAINMKNILLYLSAFMPMYFLIFVKQIIELISGKITLNFLNVFVVCLMFLFVILGLVGLYLEFFNRKQSSRKVELISKKNTTDEHFLGYFSLFVLFSITFDLSKPSMFIVFVIILIMIGIVYVKNKLFFINPLLNICGYNFYNITYKVCGEEKEENTKIFFKGNLVNNKNYMLKIKDENFSFLTDEA